MVAAESELVALEYRLADSAGSYLGREFADAVIGPARATWDTMALQMRDEMDGSTRRLAEGVSGPLAESFELLLERGFDVVDARTARLAETLPAAAAPGIELGLTASFGAVGDTLAHHLAGGLATGLEEQLRPALHSLMRDLSDSLRARVGDLDRTVADSSTVGGFRSFLGGLAAAIGAGVFLAIGLSWRRHRRALHALVEALHIADDERINEAVRGCVDQAGLGRWFANAMASRRR